MKKIIVLALFAFLLLNISISFADNASVTESQPPLVTEEKPAAVENEQKAPARESTENSVLQGQKARFDSLFKEVKEKSRSIKPAKYEVTVPVSTAGARGAEIGQADRFAVIWPETGISPVTALVENVSNAAGQGEKKELLKAQVDDFKKIFPEFSDHPLLIELADIIKKAP